MCAPLVVSPYGSKVLLHGIVLQKLMLVFSVGNCFLNEQCWEESGFH